MPKPCLACMQDKQRAQQERVEELSEQVAELEERQQSLNMALDACRQVSNPWTCLELQVHPV